MAPREEVRCRDQAQAHCHWATRWPRPYLYSFSSFSLPILMVKHTLTQAPQFVDSLRLAEDADSKGLLWQKENYAGGVCARNEHNLYLWEIRLAPGDLCSSLSMGLGHASGP